MTRLGAVSRLCLVSLVSVALVACSTTTSVERLSERRLPPEVVEQRYEVRLLQSTNNLVSFRALEHQTIREQQQVRVRTVHTRSVGECVIMTVVTFGFGVLLFCTSDTHESNRRETIGETTRVIPVSSLPQVSGNYWNSAACRTENLQSVSVTAHGDGHFVARLPRPVSEFVRLQLRMQTADGDTLGSLCLNCDVQPTCG